MPVTSHSVSQRYGFPSSATVDENEGRDYLVANGGIDQDLPGMGFHGFPTLDRVPTTSMKIARSSPR